MVIYADVLLAVNWWIDFLLLAGVGRLAGSPIRPWRLALGALAGSLSCFLLFLPPLSWWLSLGTKALSAGVMLLIGYPFSGWRRAGKMLLLLFGLSAGLAGLTGALYFFAAPTGLYYANGVVYYAVPPLVLVGLTTVCYGILWIGERWIGRRTASRQRWMLCVRKGDVSVTVPFLYDSGNRLTEPFSGLPVLVLERREAERLVTVPPSVDRLPPEGWRVVPYESVGGAGLLPAFRPDGVECRNGESLPPCYIAVCESLGQREYRGLISGSIPMEERSRVR